MFVVENSVAYFCPSNHGKVIGLIGQLQWRRSISIDLLSKVPGLESSHMEKIGKTDL